ncbi:hypothetical protein [Methylobacterium sp. ID0610]|uniref:hypothetical protein n=1 Tax=Methylobacterium carpenticola TaxID=3344827 RepID=UPI0036C078CE
MVIALMGSALLSGALTLGLTEPVLGLKTLVAAPLGSSLATAFVLICACMRSPDRSAQSSDHHHEPVC